jgi:hypothetical protein
MPKHLHLHVQRMAKKLNDSMRLSFCLFDPPHDFSRKETSDRWPNKNLARLPPAFQTNIPPLLPATPINYG